MQAEVTDKKIFYTYSNAHEKMCDEYMYKYRDALVFDRLRRSIFAQQQEFGYVSNINSYISTYVLTANTEINFQSTDGYLTFTYWTPADEIGSNLYITKVTYDRLVNLAESGKLVTNHYYEITDYSTTTGKTNTAVNGNDFALIVKADSPYKLNCKARAKVKEDDQTNHWGNSDLNKWEIWYDIKNDTTKYEWADSENGKGVIYRMIDEFGNDINYDFKNIYFLGNGVPSNVLSRFYLPNTAHLYTFCGNDRDESIYGKIFNVKIKNYSNGKYLLNNIIFKANSRYITNIVIENCNDFYVADIKCNNNSFINCNNLFFGFNLNNREYSENLIENNVFLNSDNIYTTVESSSNKIINSINITLDLDNNIVENSSYCTIQGYNNIITNSTYIFDTPIDNNYHISYNKITECSYFHTENSADYIQKINAIYTNNILFKKSNIDKIIFENNDDIIIDSNLTTSTTFKIQNIKFYPGLKNKTISIPALNNEYVIEYKPETTREYII